jgi:hypothetical protein
MNDTTTIASTVSPDHRELTSTMAYLARVLKTPTIGRCWQELAVQAREAGWSHEDYLATVLQRQVADREANGTTLRISGAHFPQVKTLEDFNTDHQPSLRRDILAHLATTTWVAKADNVVLLGPPGVGKTHLAIGLGIKAIQAGHSVLFDTATNWISRLTAAHAAGRLEQELKRLRRYKLLIIDLCRARDYADVGGVAIPETSFSRAVACGRLREGRHNHSPSRNASRLSAGRYRPGGDDTGVVLASARSLIVMSAWM